MTRRRASMQLLAPTLFALALTTAAREQCVPGPFTYDDGGQFTGNGDGDGFDQGPFPNCFDPSCPDFTCTSDGECQNFFGPDAECSPSGQCLTFQSCGLGQANDFCVEVGAGTCAYDADSDSPRDQGVCRPVSSTPLAPGERCPLDVEDVNPCGGGAFCLPIDDDEGLCVVGCGNDGTCDAGFKCTSPYLFVGGVSACMPACNLDAPACGDPRFVCTQAAFEGSCTPDNGACSIAGCDDDECFDLCTVGADDCNAGSFCIETTITSCRIDAPDQTFSVCAPPSAEGGPCSLTEPGSCANGFACAPFGFDGPRCVQQSAAAVNDGDTCDPNDTQVNRCPAGSYCARNPGGAGNEGVCQRFCDDESDCDAGQTCARANLSSFSAGDVLADVRVCAETCAANTTCANGFTCDVDGAPCTSEGACVPPESQGACSSDENCSFGDDLVCSGDFRCTLPDDACAESTCQLTDPAACPAAFSCSPYFSETPVCVPQRDVVADGGSCNANDPSVTQCGSGSVCAGSVCMRVCDQVEDCTGAQQCVRGNLLDASFPGDPFRLADVRVCAEPCAAFGPCGGGLTCDVDDGQSCNTGSGHCLPFESSPLGCNGDADCAALSGTVCHQFQCLPASDICTP